MNNAFWIFSHLGLGDHIVCCSLYRHFAKIHETVIIPVWEHNLASLQWLLNDCGNVFFYPLESESQLLTCQKEINFDDQIGLGFYNKVKRFWQGEHLGDKHYYTTQGAFNPVKWDSEFYRQAGLDPELKWQGFKLPPYSAGAQTGLMPKKVYHHDEERGFRIIDLMHQPLAEDIYILSKKDSLGRSAIYLSEAQEIHCIDSSMLNLADLMETPYCKRFVFHRYARKGLPPSLKKDWTILD